MLRFVAFFSFISCSQLLVYANNCTVDEFKSAKSGLCCKLCPAGEYMTKECTKDAKTLCQVCPANEFTSTPNSLTSCEKCKRTCDGGRDLVQSCTPVSDIKCKCPSKRYWNTLTLRCEDCTECGKGEREISQCDTFQDASCEACTMGTYLDSANNLCVLCSYCKKGEVVVDECTIWSDTKCRKEQLLTYPTVQSTSTPVTHTQWPTSVLEKSTKSRTQKEDASKPAHLEERRIFSDDITWVLICLNFLFVLVIVIFVWACIKRDSWKVKTKTPSGKEGRAVPASVVLTSKSSEAIEENNVKITTLPVNVTEELALLLNSKQGKNWKHLAGLMNYNSVFTQNLDLTPLEATQRLLEDWGHKDDATVYKLYCFLQELGRDDACSKLWPFLTQRGQGEELV